MTSSADTGQRAQQQTTTGGEAFSPLKHPRHPHDSNNRTSTSRETR